MVTENLSHFIVGGAGEFDVGRMDAVRLGKFFPLANVGTSTTRYHSAVYFYVLACDGSRRRRSTGGRDG